MCKVRDVIRFSYYLLFYSRPFYLSLIYHICSSKINDKNQILTQSNVLFIFICMTLYCTVLYCTVLYCTVLYCTVLYCTILYYAILYYTTLYSNFMIRDSRMRSMIPNEPITPFIYRVNSLYKEKGKSSLSFLPLISFLNLIGYRIRTACEFNLLYFMQFM